MRAQIVGSCSVNFYRGNALAYARKLHQCNKRPDVSMMLFKSGIGWGGTDAVNNLTALQAANWEPRAQVTVDTVRNDRRLDDQRYPDDIHQVLKR